MTVPHRQPYRRRSHYQFRTELSGLEHPRQWLGLLASVLATLAALFLLAFLMFG